jgi:hypothetical protein
MLRQWNVFQTRLLFALLHHRPFVELGRNKRKVPIVMSTPVSKRQALAWHPVHATFYAALVPRSADLASQFPTPLSSIPTCYRVLSLRYSLNSTRHFTYFRPLVSVELMSRRRCRTQQLLQRNHIPLLQLKTHFGMNSHHQASLSPRKVGETFSSPPWPTFEYKGKATPILSDPHTEIVKQYYFPISQVPRTPQI